jgi:antitoxin (DNA-binding transcriptional repressor) of toxin-antitoxin stability system
MPATLLGMSAAYEVSPDDPQGVAEAIRQAAQGATVHIVRDGQAIADIVPAHRPETAAERDARGRAIERRMAQRFGGPGIEDFRRLYDSQGWEWPGDEEIRRTHLPIQDAS